MFIADPQHKRYGHALRVQDVMDSPTPEKPEDGDILVKDQQTGAMIAAKDSQSAVLFVEEMVTLKEGTSVLA
ncbi:tetrathionate reductase subunit A, partial [Pasteurella multocida subsp. multocida str. Anand1_cattle]